MGIDLVKAVSRGEVLIGAAAVVVFLVLTWVLRGAPPGQAAESEEDLDAPHSAYRDRMVVAVVLGVILILAGGYVAIDRGILWSLPLFGLGFAVVVTLIAINARFRHGSPSLRRTIEFAGVFLNASLLAGILLVVNVIAFRYWSRPIDVTREGTYSLSSITLNQLATLDRPLSFTLIFGRGARAVRHRERLVQLLESYKAVDPSKIHVINLDQFADQSRIDDLVKRVPEVEQSRGGGLLMELGDGKDAEAVVIRAQELFQPVGGDPTRAGSDRFESSFKGEDEITSALIRLREGKKSTVGFTTGHGERSTADMSPRGPGIGNWKARLNKVGCAVVDLNLIRDEIPPDLSLLIVAAPQIPFKPEELLKLNAYAQAGRPVLLLLGNTEPHGLDEFLKSYNLELGKGILVEPTYHYNRNPLLIFASLSGELKHPVVDAMGTNRAVLLVNAAPIHLLGQAGPGGSAEPAVNRELLPAVIVRGSHQGWAESDIKNRSLKFDPKVDERGPVAVGVAVSTRPPAAANRSASQPAPRLVLFSSPAMADNIFQDIEPTNLDLLMNAASWLRDRPDTLGLPPHTHVALTLTADPLLQSRLVMVPTVTSVLLIVAVGFLVYMARRE